MRKRISAALLIVVVVLVPAALALPSPCQAQTPAQELKLTIVKIKVLELDFFDDKGNRLGVLKTSELKLPLDVVTKASNGRLKIPLADGRQVWIDGIYVTYQPSKDVAPPCDPGRGMVAGATRGSGERCK